ncbi:MAG TPA: MTH938/NDUFAF3 family protein [Candidatus Parcubacteria bacterium]|jgi:hypothetical protein|nr:MTH938/NDUFAF3 family protein [Candidatus Parcubacteria bacterium]|tara:strand:+ start:344 stop:706 length:363 start_codon:yes stop_codon:yes gene_type:complete
MIEEYNFGSIAINGKTYTYDVEVRWTDEVLSWRRREHHLIDIEDLEKAIEQEPEIIVIGTGQSGTAKVTETAKREIESQGIELIIDVTEQAIKTFNVISDESEEEDGRQRKIIGLFHLTC